MTAYQQMGHQSDNLLAEPNLWRYQGAILSPVNYSKDEIVQQIKQVGPNFDMIFDPQIYFPHTNRGQLRQWEYFPNDVDTADLSSQVWWEQIVDRLTKSCLDIKPSAACSPSVVPRSYSNEYFAQMVLVGNIFSQRLRGVSIRPIQTAIVGIDELAVPGRSMEIASILSRSQSEEVFLVLVGTTHPRRELNDPEELKSAMRLISALSASGLKVIVGFCSSDVILWKAAGATSCATGKFFNLRRFTSSRFEEPSQGGGQLPYWFEESLVSFLREADVLRLEREDKLGLGTLNNPYSVQILYQLHTSAGAPWLRTSWRQYMYAFADLENRLEHGLADPGEILAHAERAWLSLDDAGFLMEEPRNDGSWLRPWRRALAEYQQV